MKNERLVIMAVAIIAAAGEACSKLEVTMPRGPQGEQGIQGAQGVPGEDGADGMSAYEFWVASVEDDAVPDWTGGTSVQDFFKYMKGKDGADGRDGKDGEDGKDGRDGIDGKGAYELWIEYVAAGVEDPKVPGTMWDAGRTSVRDFFDFLTGKDGDKGSTPFIGENGNWWIVADGVPKDLGVQARGPKGDKGDAGRPGKDGSDGKDGHDGADGKDGTDGRDGADGRDGNVPYVGENGNWWIGVTDTGVPARGEEGLSAYQLWVADVVSDAGLENPGNGIYDVDEYPMWPRDATGVEDFYKYLSGRDGQDGGASHQDAADTLYIDRVDGTRYNVAPVISLGKTVGETVSYEYVNPFSGGAAFIVTGPGPVIIPDCRVTFTSMDGKKTYSKTSDGSGYVYLTRDELPDWYEGAPSAADDPVDISSGVKPTSFSFGGKTVSDQDRIAATCKVPYKVDLAMEVKEAALRGEYSLPVYEVHRVIEGVMEEDGFVKCASKAAEDNASGYGFPHKVPVSYKYYRNEGTVRRLRELYSTATGLSSGLPPASSGDDDLLGWFSTLANLSSTEYPGFKRKTGKESFSTPGFGDGASPSAVGVYETFVTLRSGVAQARTLRPDYGLSVTDPVRKVHVPYITRLPDGVRNASYVWKSGHTTLTFELDWDAIGASSVVDIYSGAWNGEEYSFSYKAYNGYQPREGSVFSSFSASGKFNGSIIDSKVLITWRKPVEFTDIYDKFAVLVGDVKNGPVLFRGFGGDFLYDASKDDEDGNGTAYLVGQEIEKRNASDD